MRGVTLDSGALIAFERADRRMLALVARAKERHDPLAIPAGVIGQVWRDDRRARASGQLCGVARTRDVIDASVVLCARQRQQAVVTSDPEDLVRLDATLRVVRI